MMLLDWHVLIFVHKLIPSPGWIEGVLDEYRIGITEEAGSTQLSWIEQKQYE